MESVDVYAPGMWWHVSIRGVVVRSGPAGTRAETEEGQLHAAPAAMNRPHDRCKPRLEARSRIMTTHLPHWSRYSAARGLRGGSGCLCVRFHFHQHRGGRVPPTGLSPCSLSRRLEPQPASTSSHHHHNHQSIAALEDKFPLPARLRKRAASAASTDARREREAQRWSSLTECPLNARLETEKLSPSPGVR
jgi:hypothetical protein